MSVRYVTRIVGTVSKSGRSDAKHRAAWQRKTRCTRPVTLPCSEEQIHRAVVEHLRLRAQPGVFWTHITAGDVLPPGVGGKLKALGLKPGVPDLMLIADGRVGFLELKRPGGQLSPAQRLCHAALRAAGATVFTAYGLDAALGQLEAWGVIK